jgi:heme/copper-type cytochrome/quinol oxidase subunit 4
MGAALGELVAINSIQVTVGAVVALALAQAVVKAYPELEFLRPKPQGLKAGVVVVVVAAVVLTAIVGTYLVTGISP